jgi:D-alanyl-lipoteichoic acid acyltransferase DltB (MBOAT superfamily)
MLFNSLTFLALLLPTLGLYWITSSQTVRLGWLLVASLVFYGYHHWPSVFLLLFTIGFNFAFGRLQARRRSTGLMVAAVAGNLAILGWFKYAAFVAENVAALLATLGWSVEVPRPPALLPLGISFFTFQVVAYQVDIHRGEVPAETSLARFAVFKCFFPQLIAGPIVQAKEFLPQLREVVSFDAARFHRGLWLVLAGGALKIGVADVLAQFADEAFRDPSRLTTTAAWTGLYAYAFQLYADFWGYSTMAVGLAALFGLGLPLNFDTPYRSASLQEFWRRWHVTLSGWFRDYVYIPMGGNRRRRDLNLLATMTLAGLWHGAGWNFVLWGLGHGLWLVAERHAPALPGADRRWVRIFRTVLVFHGVCLLWVFFRSPTLAVAWEYLRRLWPDPWTVSRIPSVLSQWLLLFALVQWPLARTLEGNRFAALPLKVQWLLALTCLLLILAYAGARVDFIYFNF